MLAVELPGVAQPFAARDAAEQHDAVAARVVDHDVCRARRRTGAGDLAPLVADSLPCVAEIADRARVAAEHQDSPALLIVHERRTISSGRAGLLALRPRCTVPLPRVADVATAEETSKDDEARARGIVRGADGIRGGWRRHEAAAPARMRSPAQSERETRASRV